MVDVLISWVTSRTPGSPCREGNGHEENAERKERRNWDTVGTQSASWSVSFISELINLVSRQHVLVCFVLLNGCAPDTQRWSNPILPNSYRSKLGLEPFQARTQSGNLVSTTSTTMKKLQTSQLVFSLLFFFTRLTFSSITINSHPVLCQLLLWWERQVGLTVGMELQVAIIKSNPFLFFSDKEKNWQLDQTLKKHPAFSSHLDLCRRRNGRRLIWWNDPDSSELSIWRGNHVDDAKYFAPCKNQTLPHFPWY